MVGLAAALGMDAGNGAVYRRRRVRVCVPVCVSVCQCVSECVSVRARVWVCVSMCVCENVVCARASVEPAYSYSTWYGMAHLARHTSGMVHRL